MTLEKIAKLAGVSISTVSKVLNGNSEISGATADKVMRIAEETGYLRQIKKRTNNSKKVIAVISPEYKSLYYCTILSTFEEIISDLGCMTVSGVSNFSFEKEKELVHYYSMYVDGIVLIASSSNYTRKDFDIDIPMVILIHNAENVQFDFVDMTSDTAMDDAIKYLAALGHTKIGFLGENLTTETQLLFERKLRKNSITVDNDFIEISDKRFEEAGYTGVKNMFERGKMPTAMLAAYDNIALGAIHFLNENNLNVPEDISIIGMDDISISSYLKNPLTSIATHTNEICTLAFDLLFKKIMDPKFTVISSISVKKELVIRNSTTPPKTQSFM